MLCISMRKCGNATTLKGIVVPISHPSTCVLVTGNRLGDEATIGCFLKGTNSSIYNIYILIRDEVSQCYVAKNICYGEAVR